MQHPVDKFKITADNLEKKFDNIFQYAYDFYLNSGEMPIGVAKAREGDPYEWVYERLELSVN